MKFFNDNNNKIMVQPITSSTTFLSSLTGVIKKRVIGMFKKDYFKHIYIDTEETFQEHNKSRLMNKHLAKIEYPSMTISPQISLDQPVGEMNTPLATDPNFIVPRNYRYYYPTLLEDPNGKYGIYFATRYRTFNLKFTIITDSFDQSTEIGYYLDSRFNDNTFKYMSNQIIQCEVPKTFVNAIAQVEGLFTSDVDDENTNQDDLNKLDMMLAQMGRRYSAIVRKRSMTDNKVGYFFEEKKNLLTLWTDLDMPEGIIRDTNVNGEYEITFRVQVSCYWPSAYIMSINSDAYKTITRLSGRDETDSRYLSFNVGSPIVLDRKDTIYFEDSDGDQNVGLCILHETLNFSASDEGIHEFNAAEYVWSASTGSEIMKKVHAYCLDTNVNPDKLFHILARSASGNTEYVGKVDYETFDIEFFDGKNKVYVDSDIVLDIFVNRALLDSLANEMSTHPFYSKKTAMCYMDITVAEPYIDQYNMTSYKGVVKKLRVYLFENDAEMETTDINKSVRVMTPYGIGYIGLVGEGDKLASDVKICLGKNKYGNDIIRCFEIA